MSDDIDTVQRVLKPMATAELGTLGTLDGFGMSPLHLACERGKVDIIGALLDAGCAYIPFPLASRLGMCDVHRSPQCRI